MSAVFTAFQNWIRRITGPRVVYRVRVRVRVCVNTVAVLLSSEEAVRTRASMSEYLDNSSLGEGCGDRGRRGLTRRRGRSLDRTDRTSRALAKWFSIWCSAVCSCTCYFVKSAVSVRRGAVGSFHNRVPPALTFRNGTSIHRSLFYCQRYRENSAAKKLRGQVVTSPISPDADLWGRTTPFLSATLLTIFFVPTFLFFLPTRWSNVFATQMILFCMATNARKNGKRVNFVWGVNHLERS